MTLKINYLDKKKNRPKNRAIFVHQDIKTVEFKGEFEEKIKQKILNLVKNNKKHDENKIFFLNQDFDEQIIVIYLSKSKIKNKELEFEKLGAKFYDYLKKNEVESIYIKSFAFLNENKKYFNSFLHGIKLKSYEFNLYKTKKNLKTINIFVNKFGVSYLLSLPLFIFSLFLFFVTIRDFFGKNINISQKISHFGFSLLILSILLNGVLAKEHSSNMRVGDEIKFLDKIRNIKINFETTAFNLKNSINNLNLKFYDNQELRFYLN